MTGEARFRKTWTGRLLLEHEEWESSPHGLANPGPRWRATRDGDLWRLQATRLHLGMVPLL